MKYLKCNFSNKVGRNEGEVMMDNTKIGRSRGLVPRLYNPRG